MKILKKIYSELFKYRNRNCAVIGNDCVFGLKSRIINKSSSKQAIIIGNNVMMHGSIIVAREGKVILSDYVNIRRNVYIGAVTSVTIGEGTILSDSISIMDNNNHPVSPLEREKMVKSGWSNSYWSWGNSDSSPVVIGSNVWICQGVRILKGVTIGDHSIIAAGSVVTKDVPPNSIYAGNPARFVKSIADDK